MVYNMKVTAVLEDMVDFFSTIHSTDNRKLKRKNYFFCVFENEYGASLSAVPRCLLGSETMS